VMISNPPTHMEIAIMLNLSRETVTRVFQTLQTRQIVKRDGASTLLITDPDTLRALAEGKQEL
jgi:CRP/FNR family cyclic AMP-dependent transcriptional regulator